MTAAAPTTLPTGSTDLTGRKPPTPACAGGPARLQLDGLGWRVGQKTILHNVGLQLFGGEIVGLLGPNGCGKSSVLRALLGLVRPDEGRLQVDGVPTAFGAAALRRQLGVVFQGQSLDGKLSCLQNMRLGARLYGLVGADAEARMAAALQFVELEGRAHERCEVLSGGMRRRLELARALLHSPSLLLLDEPTQGLDPMAQWRIWQRLELARKERGLSILVSSHDAEEAMHCDRVVVLVAGEVIAYDTPQALLARVGGDVISLEGYVQQDPQALAEAVRTKLGIEARVDGGLVLVEKPDGHTWVPRLVEAVGAQTLRSIGVRKPSMADAFFAVTGQALGRRPATLEV